MSVEQSACSARPVPGAKSGGSASSTRDEPLPVERASGRLRRAQRHEPGLLGEHVAHERRLLARLRIGGPVAGDRRVQLELRRARAAPRRTPRRAASRPSRRARSCPPPTAGPDGSASPGPQVDHEAPVDPHDDGRAELAARLEPGRERLADRRERRVADGRGARAARADYGGSPATAHERGGRQPRPFRQRLQSHAPAAALPRPLPAVRPRRYGLATRAPIRHGVTDAIARPGSRLLLAAARARRRFGDRARRRVGRREPARRAPPRTRTCCSASPATPRASRARRARSRASTRRSSAGARARPTARRSPASSRRSARSRCCTSAPAAASQPQRGDHAGGDRAGQGRLVPDRAQPRDRELGQGDLRAADGRDEQPRRLLRRLQRERRAEGRRPRAGPATARRSRAST